MVLRIMRRALAASFVFVLTIVVFGFISQEKMLSLLVILTSIMFALYMLEQCSQLEDIVRGAPEDED